MALDLKNDYAENANPNKWKTSEQELLNSFKTAWLKQPVFSPKPENEIEKQEPKEDDPTIKEATFKR